MNKVVIAFLPMVLFAGIVLPGDSCQDKPAGSLHTEQLDGPYVLYQGDKVFVKYILDAHGTKTVKSDSMALAQKGDISLTVLTDEPGKPFTVKLKSQLQNEETEFPDVKKQFIVSDIEGNFRAFRKLLQANKIIDENLNWTFGDGHLALTGDFVDRGEQQTEVLWLIYSLEEKAKAAGGYVHYVLGNHEIMNMNGDLRYLHQKYKDHAVLLNEKFVALYGENSELGRWLRTKNVLEKVGDILFCHGGISQAVNRMNFPTSKINRLVRPYYADSTYKYDTPETDTLYSDLGPFWYRGYYTGTVKASISQVDSTLSAYKVNHIAT
ncbi:MAG: metallophosphoesterase, partial [Ferruginibacter sp.]|nr:metallophosphoesterase [Chitinophagaceae bacterium]